MSGQRARWRVMVASALAVLIPGGLVSAAPVTSADSASGMSLRSSLDLGQTTEIAFWGTTAVVARKDPVDPRNDGFSVIDISNPSKPKEIGRLRCAGSRRDISIWNDLVFLSVDGQSDGAWDGTGCGANPVPVGSSGSFAGIRVVSIEDPTAPVQVAAVSTNCGFGSHTHTLLPDPVSDPTRLLVYANSTYCGTVVEVPLDSPEAARSLAVLPDLVCHDLTVFVPRRLGACSGEPPVRTKLLDLSDPERPLTLAVIANGASVPFSTNHSSAFSWDGETLAIGDEINSGLAECHAESDDPQGRIWFHDISNPRLPILRGSYQLPQRVTEGRYCSAHYFSVVPLKGDRDVLTSGWYGEGVTVVDFTDPTDAYQLAYYTAAPDHPTKHAFVYDGYWYNGAVYATNFQEKGYGESTTERSLDVFSLERGVMPPWHCLPALNAQTQIGPAEWSGKCKDKSVGSGATDRRFSR